MRGNLFIQRTVVYGTSRPMMQLRQVLCQHFKDTWTRIHIEWFSALRVKCGQVGLAQIGHLGRHGPEARRPVSVLYDPITVFHHFLHPLCISFNGCRLHLSSSCCTSLQAPTNAYGHGTTQITLAVYSRHTMCIVYRKCLYIFAMNMLIWPLFDVQFMLQNVTSMHRTCRMKFPLSPLLMVH